MLRMLKRSVSTIIVFTAKRFRLIENRDCDAFFFFLFFVFRNVWITGDFGVTYDMAHV